jgi:nicotinamide-nucleotide amidase
VRAAILAIGDELTSGYRIDTNSQAISARLTPLPVEVVLHVTVGDKPTAMKVGLRTALDAAECVIVTGGLGPTEDDLTRHVIASHFGLHLKENAEALARMRERYTRRHRRMPESNRVQALIPSGSQVIQNSRGTAAGFYLEVEGKHIFVTPGIPYEMVGMLEAFILPRLMRLMGIGRPIRQAFVKVYGLPESEINERIRPMVARDRNPLLGLLPHQGTITIELTASADTSEQADQLIRTDIEALWSALGVYVISEDGRDLPQVVGDLLCDRGLTIGAIEVGTAGLLAARLSEPDGSHRYFRGSTILVPDSRADGNRPVEPAGHSALQLARSARQESGANIGVGVGAVEIPGDSTSDRPYGTLQIGIDLEGREAVRSLSFTQDSVGIREWAADGALAEVRLAVLAAR